MRRTAALGMLMLAAGLLVAAGCGDDGPSRQEVVSEMTETAVPERYAELAAEADELVGLVDTMCATSTAESAAEVVEQVGEVRALWLGLGPFWFGPVADQRSRSIIDWDVDPDEIDALAAGDQSVDADSLRELAGGDQRGLGAVEVLATGPLDDRRCAYAMGAAELVADETASLADAWAEAAPTFTESRDAASDTSGDIASESLFALATVLDAEASEARATIEGARWALVGDDGDGGLAPLLGEEVVEQLVLELDALAANPTEETVMALSRTIRTNVASDLGLSVNFSDADGDG